MKKFLYGWINRSVRHFSFFIGRFLLLSALLVLISSGIRGSGDSVLGQGYYYLVMPGIACHETGHAVGCLCTGRKIIEFAPFKPHGDTLGYVRWDPGNITLSTFVFAFLIGTAPLWFGCFITLLFCMILTKKKLIPDYQDAYMAGMLSSGLTYWKHVAGYSVSMIKSLFQKTKLRLFCKIIVFYLLFCIISEMSPSLTDLKTSIPGFILLGLVFPVLNIIPLIGRELDLLTIKLSPFFFILHTVMFFVLILDLLIFCCIVLPIEVLF